MRILLLHADDADLGWWRHEKWGRVVDLGKAGRDTYERWSEIFGCPVTPFPRLDLSDFKAVRRTLFSGLGRMMDSHGIDWWELISMGYHERVERIVGLGKLAEQIVGDDEVFVSRAGFEARVMEILLRRAVRAPRPAGPTVGKWRRIAGLAKKLRPRQMLEIVGDKYDAGYSIRRWVSRSERGSDRPVVLLPTAYVNVSRTGLAYAAALPERDFLLVATRQSGWIKALPRNVKAARLASYAPGKYSKDECEHLLECWSDLQMEFRDRPEFFVLDKLGAFERVPAMLRDGLAARDAWLQVLEREPVTAVLCADDSNTYTRLPLLLARKQGLAAIACHHGALDGRHLIKRNHADVILAKGRMEKDYLVRTCGVAEEEIEIGAPPREDSPGPRREEGVIVFFSEPYELAGGRGIEFYREILPGLAEIAMARRCELVVKLHPQENLRERQHCVDAVLGPEQRRVVRMVAGRLNEELLRQAWFAVTVVSTTAVECTLRGIPVFLCGWLECTNWRYAEQFAWFGAGTGLSSPGEIRGIPARLKEFERKITADLWVPIKPGRLDDLFSQREHARIATAV